jgi:hypothetical protein
MITQAHIFETEQDCLDAIALIDESLGLPNEQHDTHSNPMQSGCGKWFIQADNHSCNVLGESVEFEIVPKEMEEM